MTTRSTPATAQLHTLRRRLTVLLASVAALGLGTLAVITTIVDSRLRADEDTVYRQGLASRLAAYVYPDDTGQWNTDGIINDGAWQVADAVLVATRSGQVLYSSHDITQFSPLLAAGVNDAAEVGVEGSVLVDNRSLVAAAAPFWDFETVEGVVIVAWEGGVDQGQRELRLLVWGAAAALTLLSATAAWYVAGNVVRPVAEALGREERFLSTAAHQIRTPLGKVRALTDSALRTSNHIEPSAASQQLRGELHRLAAVADEAANNAADLLLAGRIDSATLGVRREPIRLDQLVGAFEDTYAELAVEAFEPVTVTADPVLLHHAVSNLLSNAVQHGRRNDQPLLISASVRSEDSVGVLVVSDNGPGLGPIDPNTLFERYGKTGQANGLGLWIVHTIITENGGTVNAVDGPGARFVVQLPLTEAPTDDPRRTAGPDTVNPVHPVPALNLLSGSEAAQVGAPGALPRLVHHPFHRAVDRFEPGGS